MMDCAVPGAGQTRPPATRGRDPASTTSSRSTTRTGAAVMAVDHCSLDIAAGEICMIVGPSGCGKTTLLNAIAGFHEHHLRQHLHRRRGAVRPGQAEGRAGLGPHRRVPERRAVPVEDQPRERRLRAGDAGQDEQEGGLREGPRDDGRRRALRASSTTIPGEVSSGMRRRVEIVRALMNDPKVLLLDEPYRALDSLTKSVMHEALLEIYYRNKVTIFFITHDLEEAIFLGHKVAIMTTRPCRPKKMLEVDIPHPRDYSVLTSQALPRADGGDHRRGARGGAARRSRPARRKAEHGAATSAARLFTASALARRAVVSIVVFVVLWEIGSRSKELASESSRCSRHLARWAGLLPWIGAVPAPTRCSGRGRGARRRRATGRAGT